MLKRIGLSCAVTICSIVIVVWIIIVCCVFSTNGYTIAFNGEIEPYTLKALIIEDLKMHPKSLMSEISSRLPDVELNDLRNTVYKMVGDELIANGGRTYRRYELNDGRKEIEKKMGKRIV